MMSYGGWDFTDESIVSSLDLLVGAFEMPQREYVGQMGDWFKETMIEENYG